MAVVLPATPPSCPLTPRTRTLHMGRAQLSFDHCTAYLWVSLTSPVTPLSSAKQVFTEAGGDGERKDGRKVERRKEGKKERRKEGKKERIKERKDGRKKDRKSESKNEINKF